jgi:endoglycosylceramidase
MHQDLYALRYGGDGAPEWAIYDDGQPYEYQTPWELNYLQPAVKAAINNFWCPENGHQELQDNFIDAMLVALDELADHPAVIGIDLYNEPTMATLRGFLHFERRYLTPLLQRAINAIRQKNNDLWLFFEPAALGANQGFRSKLGKLHDPRQGEPRLVYFPHLYTLDLDIRGRYLGWPVWINFWAHQRRKETTSFRTPLMVGEFGLSENQPGAMKFLSDVLPMFDEITSGWFYWSYDRTDWGLHDEDWQDLMKTNLLVRPYPRRIAGEQPAFHWNPKRKIFSMSFLSAASIGRSQTTELYLPPRSWPNGWELINTGVEILQSFDHKRNLLSIYAKLPGKVVFRIQNQFTNSIIQE